MKREVWHYKLANSDCIQKAIKNFDWEKALLNVDVNKKVLFFNGTIRNIIRNFIPHEIVISDDRGQPWMTRLIKKAVKDKNLFYQHFVKNTDFTNNDINLERLRSLQNNLTNTIETTKQQYFAKIAKKLSDPTISSKTYWSILKCFLTGKNVPCILPIFHENRFITDFREKVELFNSFFPNQCSLIRNRGVLPTDYEFFTVKSLSNIIFTDNDIRKIISSLDPNKAHGHDMISIRMLNIYGDSIYKPLGPIFRACLEHAVFPQNWKKADVVPIHEKTIINQ